MQYDAIIQYTNEFYLSTQLLRQFMKYFSIFPTSNTGLSSQGKLNEFFYIT